MTTERPCRIYTTSSLEIDLDVVDLIRYYPREPGLRGQGEGADVPIAYLYIHGSCVAIRGTEPIQKLRCAWKAWKTRGEQ